MNNHEYLTDIHLDKQENPTFENVHTIEIPPHFRTLKIKRTSYGSKFNRYIQLPYTQFYFVKYYYVYSSQSNIPLKQIVQNGELTNIPPWNQNLIESRKICWGDSSQFINNQTTVKSIIDIFWNSQFDEFITMIMFKSPFRISKIQEYNTK